VDVTLSLTLAMLRGMRMIHWMGRSCGFELMAAMVKNRTGSCLDHCHCHCHCPLLVWMMVHGVVKVDGYLALKSIVIEQVILIYC
jgi:hypothetical protein